MHLSGVINRVPAIKPFLMYTKTPINMMGFAASHTPMGFFIDEFNKFSLPFEKMPKERITQLLNGRGISTTDPYLQMTQYNAIRAELRGRKAIGTAATLATVGLFLKDNITGNGVYDRQKQSARRDYDWKPRSIRLPGGEWVSYDNLGAITDWMALTADIMDNFDVLDEGGFTQLMSGMGFVISASFTDKSMLAGIEPLYDILAGNPAAINRWAQSFGTAAVLPGSSQIAELSRLMMPNLRVVEENLGAMIANRTPFKATLPELYDYIDGDKVGMPDNIMARLWNTYSPFKINGKISPEKQFLIDIEYDNRPSMKTDGRGVDLTLEEQAQVYEIMGKTGSFKKVIQRVMRTQGGKEFREAFKNARANNELPPRLEDYAEVHLELDAGLREAKLDAIGIINARSGESIDIRRFEQEEDRSKNRQAERINKQIRVK